MKVGNASGRPGDTSPTAGEGGRAKRRKSERVGKGDSAEAVSFEQAVAEAKARAERTEWNALIEEIDAAAARLLKAPTEANLVAYRGRVAALVERATRGSYRVETVESARFAANQKVFQIARRIDEALERLAREVLARNEDATRLAAKIDEIRGMIVDLTR